MSKLAFASTTVLGSSLLAHRLHTYVTLAACRLPDIPLHFLCTQFRQLIHCSELLPTPFPHTPQFHFPDSSTSPIPHPPTIILVFLTFTFRPFTSIPTFHFNNFSLSSSSLSAISTRSSAYRNSNGSPSCNSLETMSITITNSSGLRAD